MKMSKDYSFLKPIIISDKCDKSERMMGLWGKESTYTKLLQRISEKNEEGLELRLSLIHICIVETAKANNLNIFQYLYMVLLYMPDYMNSSAGIEPVSYTHLDVYKRQPWALWQAVEQRDQRALHRVAQRVTATQ